MTPALPPGGLDGGDLRLASKHRTSTLGERRPVSQAIMDDLESMIETYHVLAASSRGQDAMSAALLFRDKIMPKVEAIVRGNFNYFSGRHQLTMQLIDRLTSTRSAQFIMEEINDKKH